MKYLKQVLTVTLWEYRRFFKPKNELLGIGVMILVFFLVYFIGKYAASAEEEKTSLTISETLDVKLTSLLSQEFELNKISENQKDNYIKQISDNREGVLLWNDDAGFVLYSYKKPQAFKKLNKILNTYNQTRAMEEIKLSPENLQHILKPVSITEKYFEETSGRKVLVYFFAGLMILAVVLSFAYQFTAITGEKQLKITEQIVSAIKPQVWMDGKILGITLTGLSSLITYSIISILGGLLFFQFTDVPLNYIFQVLHAPSIIIFLLFALMSVLMWNSLLAAIASVITDPNNSGKSSLMLLPVLFVVITLVISPQNKLAVFLSWFPLTSATAMPMRWVVGNVDLWQLAGSFILLTATFYLLRKLAAKVFRVSILMSGKEPTWGEIIKLAKEA